MKLGRGLAVMLWFLVFCGVGLVSPLVGGEPLSKEFCLLIALTVAWCNDE